MRLYANQTTNNAAKKNQQNVNPFSFSKSSQPIERPLQTGCACDGYCPRCLPIQMTPKISSPGDKFEQEADVAANQIMAMKEPQSQNATQSGSSGHSSSVIQREEEDSETQEENELVQLKRKSKSSVSPRSTSAFHPLQSGGQPLSQTSRNYFEPRFGQDFSTVRIHTDTQASTSAEQVNAKAYTSGNHIVFGNGYYQPESHPGRHLMAHELSHVVQQNGGQSGKDTVALSPVDESYIQRDEEEQGPLDALMDLGWELGGEYAEDFFNNTLTEEGRQALFGATGTTTSEEFLKLLGKQGMEKIMAERMTPEEQQLLKDLIASITMSPQFIDDIFVDEIGQAISENLDQFIGFLLVFAALEFGIFAAGFAPEGISTLIAVILQAIILFFFAVFAGMEMANVATHGYEWIRLVHAAKGDKATLEEASKAFLRMIRHLILMILMLIGVKVKFGKVVGGLEALEAAGAGSTVFARGMQPAMQGAGSGVSQFRGLLPGEPPIKIPPSVRPPLRPPVRPGPVRPGPVKPTPIEPVPVEPAPVRVTPPAKTPSPVWQGADALARGGLEGQLFGTSSSLYEEPYDYPDYDEQPDTETEEDTDDDICECQEKAPDAIPIMWPQPLWTVTPSACSAETGYCDPGSTDATYNMPHSQIVVKRGSTYYDANRPEIGRYLTRIGNPPFNIDYPFAYPIHHKWPLYLGGPGNHERAEGEYTAEGQTVIPPNLVIMNPTIHSTWHSLLETQPWDPRLGPGPGPLTPDGTKFCIVNYR